MTHVVDWPIRLSITEDDARTVARAVITTKDNTLSAEGVAVRNPTDSDVPEIGDELAAGRALTELGRLLVSAAAADVAAFGDEPVRLTY
jgi:hypothetical protein